MPRTGERAGTGKDNRPLAFGIRSLGYARTEFGPDKPGEDWFAKVKGFYSKAGLVKALEAIVMDEHTNGTTRREAINALGQLGERALLGKLVARLSKQRSLAGDALARAAELWSKGEY